MMRRRSECSDNEKPSLDVEGFVLGLECKGSCKLPRESKSFDKRKTKVQLRFIIGIALFSF